MARRKKQAETLSREQAWDAKPVALPVRRREPLADGGQRLTVDVSPSGAFRWLLRAPEKVTKQFELDAMGLEVHRMCDGNKNVRHIVQKFAKTHDVNRHEAERAVAAFLRTMMRKGIVSMAVKK